MHLSRISIDQQRAIVGIDVQQANITIESQQPKMTVESEAPEMTIERENPTFKVNWNKLWNDMGTPHSMDFSKKIRNKARADAHKGVSEAVADGDLLGNAKMGGIRVDDIARSKVKKSMPDTNIGLVPKEGASIKWDKGDFKISWSKHNISIEWEGEYMPQIQVEPFSIEIYLKQEPYIKITITEDEKLIPKVVGRVVDQEI